MNFSEPDELVRDIPETICQLIDEVDKYPCNWSIRKELAKKCHEEGMSTDASEQRYHAVTIMMLDVMQLLPAIQKHMLVAQLGYQPKLAEAIVWLQTWLASRASYQAHIENHKLASKYRKKIDDCLSPMPLAIMQAYADTENKKYRTQLDKAREFINMARHILSEMPV
jgi:hypothetical protein